MKRALAAVVAVVAFGTGCKDKRVDALLPEVAALKTDVATLKTEHDRTRAKLQEVLVYINGNTAPLVDLEDWITIVNRKLFPTGDPTRPSNPPEPF